MGEYGTEMDVTKITGSAPGYIGSDQQSGLVSLVKQYPSSIVLFDEIEKAHPKVFDTILNILDTGEMTDNHKNKVSFRNCIIAFTTNLGYDKDFAKSKGVGFHKYKTENEDILEVVKDHFRPEFINRLDDIIVFNGLHADVAKLLVDRYIVEYENLSERKVAVNPNDYDIIIKDADIETYGARSLKRAVRRQMLEIFKRNKLADLSGFTIGELKTLAKNLELTGYTKLAKAELLTLLQAMNLTDMQVKQFQTDVEEFTDF